MSIESSTWKKSWQFCRVMWPNLTALSWNSVVSSETKIRIQGSARMRAKRVIKNEMRIILLMVLLLMLLQHVLQHALQHWLFDLSLGTGTLIGHSSWSIRRSWRALDLILVISLGEVTRYHLHVSFKIIQNQSQQSLWRNSSFNWIELIFEAPLTGGKKRRRFQPIGSNDTFWYEQLMIIECRCYRDRSHWVSKSMKLSINVKIKKN